MNSTAIRPLEVEALDVVRVLNRAQEIEGWVSRRLKDTPVSGSAQARIVLMVSAEPGMGSSAIAAVLHQEAHSTSGLLNRLEDAELIDRTRDKTDRRRIHVTLTPQGEALVELLRAVFREAEVALR